MRQIAFLLVAVATLVGDVTFTVPRTGHAHQEAAPIFVTEIPPGYRDWRLISVAHEEGQLNIDSKTCPGRESNPYGG